MTQRQLIAAIEAFFASSQLEKIDVEILQPAEPFLDSVGEDLRRRIFMTENENGDMLCLRPEFTIPVCLAHIKMGESLPHCYAYLGEVFRQRRVGGRSFYQAGIEDLGDNQQAHADVRSLCDALALLRTIVPNVSFDILIGDHGMFDAIIAALGLSSSWQRRLSRCFGDPSRLRAVLADLAKPSPDLNVPPDLAKALMNEDEEGLTALIEMQMYEAGLPLHSSRTSVEIATRLIEKQALVRNPLDKDKLQILEDFLSLRVSLDKAKVALSDFAKQARLDLDAALAQFCERIGALTERGERLENIYYDAAFGRLLDYYTGFVYEISLPGKILVGGGRYDTLLHLLGASTYVPAVGFSLWLDRLEPLFGSRGNLS